MSSAGPILCFKCQRYMHIMAVCCLPSDVVYITGIIGLAVSFLLTGYRNSVGFQLHRLHLDDRHNSDVQCIVWILSVQYSYKCDFTIMRLCRMLQCVSLRLKEPSQVKM